jgi:hypothetical protein
MPKLPTWKTYFDPSMDGAKDEEVEALASHLRQSVDLGEDGKEALRMANAQRPEFRALTTRKAIEQAMRELFNRDAA